MQPGGKDASREPETSGEPQEHNDMNQGIEDDTDLKLNSRAQVLRNT